MYAYLLHTYGTWTDAQTSGHHALPTFDFVSVQLYEGWSRINMESSQIARLAVTAPATTPPSPLYAAATDTMVQRIVHTVLQTTHGWTVRFSDDAGTHHLGDQLVHVAPDRLLIGSFVVL